MIWIIKLARLVSCFMYGYLTMDVIRMFWRANRKMEAIAYPILFVCILIFMTVEVSGAVK